MVNVIEQSLVENTGNVSYASAYLCYKSNN